MNTNGIFDGMKGLFADLTGKNWFGKEDFVLLKTALMLAAVDGEVGADACNAALAQKVKEARNQAIAERYSRAAAFDK